MKKKTGQLYKIPIREYPPDGHDPQGDLVYPTKNEPKGNIPVGFIVRQFTKEHKYLIMLALGTPLPADAEIILQVADIVEVMAEEATFSLITKTKLRDAVRKFPGVLWLQAAASAVGL